MLSLSSRVALLATSVLVVACGGGGGGGGSPTPPPPPAATFSVSGEVRLAENTLVDSDVNDVNAPYASNDTFTAAQVLPNPVSLGGYVNQLNQGPNGRSRAAGDPSDVYRIDGVAGQSVSIVVADPLAGDIDLYLYDANHNEVAASEGTGRLETVVIPATGTYYVEAYAFEGASNYVLALGQAVAAGAGDGTLLSTAEFVPGEVIVHWRRQPGTQHADRRGAASAMAAHGLTRLAGLDTADNDGDWLVRIDDPARLAAQSRQGRRSALAAGTPASALTQRQLKSATVQAIKRLRADPSVAYAEPNYIRRPQAVPVDQYYRLQWHYPLINLPAAWDITTGSSSVRVAVVDTGVLVNHPDLQGQLLPGYDFITDAARARDGNGPDNNPDDAGDTNGPGGASSFHGTHVAGTIAAASNTTQGVAGVAWGARIMPVRVLGVGGGTSFDISNGVLWAARLTNSSGTLPAQRADIINLSLGGGSFSQAEQNVYDQVRAAGVIVVAAAGNESTTQLSYPASYNNVISVSAVGIRKTLASYSNSGTAVDVAGPGGDSGDVNGDGYQDLVLSTVGDDSSGQTVYGYGLKAGTSMATPHVAGVLALMKSVNPALTPADIDTLLAAGRLTVDIGAPGRDDSFGHGLIDALKAVQAAQAGGGGTAPALLVVAPGALNFGPATTTQTITTSNGGAQALQVTSVQAVPAASWLNVAAPGGASGLGAYTITANRTGLAPGAYTTTLRFVSNANTVNVPVVLQVSAGGTAVASSVGHLYVQLVNPDTLQGVRQVRMNPVNGVYSFNFDNVTPGTYLVVAGTDPDNDDAICDIGEACAAYLNLDDPVRVTVDANKSGLVFNGGYVTSIGANAQAIGKGAKAGSFRRIAEASR
jgi:serine protease